MTRKDGRNAQTVASYKYNKKNYEQIAIRVKKGLRADFNAACKLEGVSGADYLTRCIMDLIRKHKTEGSDPGCVIEAGAENNPGAAVHETDI